MAGRQAAVSRSTSERRQRRFGIGAAVSIVGASLYTMDGGQRAVLFDRFRGVSEQTFGGSRITSSSISVLAPILSPLSSGTKYLQMVHLTLRVLSRPEFSCRMELSSRGQWSRSKWHNRRRSFPSFVDLPLGIRGRNRHEKNSDSRL